MANDKPKLMGMQPSLPWLFNPQFDTLITGDVDGDGRDEIIITNAPGGLGAGDSAVDAGESIPMLSVLSYFKYTDLSPDWTDDTWGQMVCMWSGLGTVPSVDGNKNWKLDFTQRFVAADIDRDGVDEIVCFRQWGNTSLGVLKWDPRAYTFYSMCAPFVVDPAPGWQIFCGDLDGQGDAEVVIFNPITAIIRVYKWTGSSFEQLFSDQKLGDTQLEAGDAILLARLFGDRGDNSHQIFLYRASQLMYGVYKWNGSLFSAMFGGAKAIGRLELNKLSRMAFADVDGDKNDELVMFWDYDSYIGVVKRSQMAFDVMWASKGSADQFTLNPATQFFFADLDGGSASEIVLYNPKLFDTEKGSDVDTFGVLQWNGSAFELMTSYPNVIGGVALSPNNQFLGARFDGGPGDQILIYAADYAAMMIQRWDGSALQQEWKAAHSTAAWNLALITAGPRRSLWPFEGSQFEVYRYVSNEVDPGDFDLRAAYTNENDVDSFGGWASTIHGNLSAPPPNNFSESNWQFVNSTLYQELLAVPKVWALTANRATAAGAIRDQQNSDLSWVQNHLTLTPAPGATVDYWLSQVLVAAIWGAATIPFAAEGVSIWQINAVISMTASLFGSALSAPVSGSQSDTYKDFPTMIYNTYSAAIDAGAVDEQIVHTDGIMLPLVYELATGPWFWGSTAASDLAAAAQNNNRVVFYKSLLPTVFTMMVWEGVSESEPFMVRQTIEGPLTVFIDAPSNSYFVEQVSDEGLYNIYMLYNGGDLGGYTNFQYPDKSLTDDLFNTLAVNRAAFFKGLRGWDTIDRVSAS